jgi:hypothetical protein
MPVWKRHYEKIFLGRPETRVKSLKKIWPGIAEQSHLPTLMISPPHLISDQLKSN